MKRHCKTKKTKKDGKTEKIDIQTEIIDWQREKDHDKETVKDIETDNDKETAKNRQTLKDKGTDRDKESVKNRQTVKVRPKPKGGGSSKQ